MSEETAIEQTVETPVETAQNNFVIPEEYSTQSWAENIKSPDDLWKQHANAQSLIGKRPAGIPTQDAPQEEWDKFYKALGRPDEPSAYEFNLSEEIQLPEGTDLAPYEEKARSFFHKLGLPADKANEAWNDYLKMEIEATAARSTELDKQYDEITSKLFGEKYEEASSKAQATIKNVLPEELHSAIQQLGNENPAGLASLIALDNYYRNEISALNKKFGQEDTLASGGQTQATSKDEVLAKIRDAKAKIASNSMFETEEIKKAKVDLEEYRKQLQGFF